METALKWDQWQRENKNGWPVLVSASPWTSGIEECKNNNGKSITNQIKTFIANVI